MKSRITITVLFIMLTSCTPTARINISASDRFESTPPTRVTLAGFRLQPTFGVADPIMEHASKFQDDVRRALTAKGYKLVDQHEAEAVFELRLTSTENAIMSEEELRFLKGVRGSRMTHANPRLRSLQSDSFVLAARTPKGEPLWNGICRITDIDTPPQDKIIREPNQRVAIPLDSAELCLVDLLKDLPTAPK